jgi:hypothetical protein
MALSPNWGAKFHSANSIKTTAKQNPVVSRSAPHVHKLTHKPCSSGANKAYGQRREILQRSPNRNQDPLQTLTREQDSDTQQQ